MRDKPRPENLAAKKRMNEVLIVGMLFLVLLGATAFYFYSRLLYTERKMGLIESILLDIKMSMDMEEEHDVVYEGKIGPGGKVSMTPPQAPAPQAQPSSTENDIAYYNAVLESTPTSEDTTKVTEMPPEMPSPMPPAPPAPQVVAPQPLPASEINYDAYSRDELAAIAERRGLRVTKRMGKTAIVNLLRESGANPSGAPEQEVADGVPASSSLEGSGGGAPLDAGMVEELSVDA